MIADLHAAARVLVGARLVVAYLCAPADVEAFELTGKLPAEHSSRFVKRAVSGFMVVGAGATKDQIAPAEVAEILRSSGERFTHLEHLEVIRLLSQCGLALAERPMRAILERLETVTR